MFKSLDRPLWKTTIHNPVKLLNQIEPYRLVAAGQDADFLNNYDTIVAGFRNASINGENWCQTHYPLLTKRIVAYFSMEFAIHSSLPLYAGGLGVLAGDYCKEASDLGLPIIGIGFLYPQGYFRQRISEDGWQEEDYRQLNFSESPLLPLLDSQNRLIKVAVTLDSHSVFVTAWQVKVGKAKLYLLDTRLEENLPADRELSARLYGGNSEQRLKQEMVLGIGGVRLFRELKVDPVIWHANEGHTAFMMLELPRTG